MPTDPTLNVTRPAKLNASIRAEGSSGQYQCASKGVRGGLQLLPRQPEREERQKAKRATEVGDAR
jgi:Arc/MetJ-type ribon-helix-helix transcriptional regulator